MITSTYKLLDYYIKLLPEIKDIDLYSNFTFDEKVNNRHNYPAIFIEYLPTKITQLLKKYDKCEMNINLHLVHRNTNIDELVLVDKLSKHLRNINNLQSDNLPENILNEDIIIWPLRRDGVIFNGRIFNNELKEVVLNYKFIVIDATGAEKDEYISLLNFEVNGKIIN